MKSWKSCRLVDIAKLLWISLWFLLLLLVFCFLSWLALILVHSDSRQVYYVLCCCLAWQGFLACWWAFLFSKGIWFFKGIFFLFPYNVFPCTLPFLCWTSLKLASINLELSVLRSNSLWNRNALDEIWRVILSMMLWFLDSFGLGCSKAVGKCFWKIWDCGLWLFCSKHVGFFFFF